jgi:hypothetical protein
LYKNRLASAQWAIEKNEISGAAKSRHLFAEGSHLIDIGDAMCGDFTSTHNEQG